MPMLRPRISASSSSLEAHEVVAGDPHGAGGRPLEPGDHHQQRGLARAARADDGDRFAGRDVDIDALRISTGPARLASVSETSSQGDDGFGHDRKRLPARGLASGSASFYVNSVTGRHGAEERHPMRTGAIEGDARKHGVSRSPLQLARCRARLRRNRGPGRASRCASSYSATAWWRASGSSRRMPSRRSWSAP